MYSGNLRRTPPETRARIDAFYRERERKARLAKQSVAREQHLADVEKAENARLSRLNGMPRITRPADEAADGADLP